MSSQLTTILPNAFNSSSLTNLTFSRADGFRFTQGMAQKGFFEPSSLFKALVYYHPVIYIPTTESD
jgi:hypothetical protein